MSDEADTRRFRLAQTNRIIRFADAYGFETLENVTVDVLAPILDERGKVLPLSVDFDAVDRGDYGTV